MICLYNEVTKTPNTESQRFNGLECHWTNWSLHVLTPWGDFLGPMVISTQSSDAKKL